MCKPGCVEPRASHDGPRGCDKVATAAATPQGRIRHPNSLLKKVFEVSRWATLIQDPSARRTKDSQPSGFGFEYCASHVRFRVFQQTAKAKYRQDHCIWFGSTGRTDGDFCG